MQNRGVFVFLLTLSMLSVVSAAGNDSSVSDRAYACLENQVATKPSLALDEALFSVMALGSGEKALKVIEQEEKKESTGSCWPKGGCTIKQTAQAVLALRQAGRDVTPGTNWLLNKTGVATDLAWYLEIDTEQQRPSSCTIKYDAGSYTVRIRDDMRLSSSAGSCLSLSPSGFLLRVRESCLSKTFDVSCNETFVTSLVYQKDKGTDQDCLNLGNQTCFVSDSSHTSASLGTTREQIQAYCLKQGAACDYEGSLWGVYALWKTNKDTNKYLPYLIALADGHERHFAAAFLYGLTGNTDFFSTIAQAQAAQGYWEIRGSPYTRYYDTALALVGIGGNAEGEEAKTYLESIQTREGCWNNNRIVDTGFLLYAGWNKGARGGGGTGGSGSSAFCTEAGFSCARQDACLANGGTVKTGFECTGFGVCCSVSVSEQSCAAQGGRVCGASQVCAGKRASSAEGSCCLGECEAGQIVVDDECDLAGGTCSASCGEGEEASIEGCSGSGEVCCMPIQDSTSTNWILILLLGILILLIILGIIYREKLRLWYFSWRKGSTTPAVRQVPSGRAPPPAYRPAPRPFARPAPRPGPKPFSNELEETLKKLREMSK
jgi:hypothetical protein